MKKVGRNVQIGCAWVVACLMAGSAVVSVAQYVDPNKLPEPGVIPIQPTKKSVFAPKPANVSLTAPPGFTVTLLTEGLPAGARWMTTAPNGDIFVSGYLSNKIMILRDGSKDGRYNTKFIYLPTGAGAPGNDRTNRGSNRSGRNFAPAQTAPAATGGSPAAGGATAGRSASAPARAGSQNEGPSPMSIDPSTGLPRGEAATRAAALPCKANTPGVTGTTGIKNPMGMAFHGGYLYIANTDSIVRYEYTPGDHEAMGEPERVALLPSGGVNNQRNMVFNRAGTKMYVSIGSNSNNLAGEDCRRAAIMEYNIDGSGGKVYASGLRNPLALAWQPGSDILWTTVTERYGYGDDLVPDFATSLVDGGFYGWPYTYIGKHYDPKYLGGQTAIVKNSLTPDVVLPAHSAPSGIAFYAPFTPAPARQFPAQFWGMFLSLSGSTNDSSVARGYKVVFVPFAQGGKPVPSAMVDFVTGFVLSDGQDGKPITYWGRPTALLVANDGSLLILDEAEPTSANVNSSKIWRVTYTGVAPAAQ
ncbi:MAG TPA: PQQ-dependent sugar dehydrogenase [Terriglobia bacterium]|nr:PQQ-dependent sugar dehydrogenase [Terriglobia bacterium]